MTYFPRIHYQQHHCNHQHYFSCVRSVHFLPVNHHVKYPKTCLLCGWRRIVIPTKIEASVRSVSQTSDDVSDDSGIISDSEFDNDGFIGRRLLKKDKFDLLRVNLYQNLNDPVVTKLNQANSVQEVFDTVEHCREHLTVEQSSQAIVTLWDLQKMYERYGFDSPFVTNSQRNFLLEKILTHSVFKKLLVHLENVCENLNNTALSCLLLYLNKLGLRNDSTLMQKLTVLCMERLDDFSLNALSRLTVYLRDQGIKAYFMQSKLLPAVAAKLKTCSTPDELYLITICLNSTKKLVTESLLDDYRKLIEKNLDDGCFEECDSKVILKIIKFVSYMEWPSKHRLLFRRLMLYLVDRVHLLSAMQIMDLSNYLQSCLEPLALSRKIHQHSISLFEISKSSGGGSELIFLAPYCSLKAKRYFEELVAEYLDNSDFHEYIVILFKILRDFKTSNIQLCNAFWINSMKAVEREIKRAPVTYLGFEDSIRRKVYQKYMYFNNNLGGTYRNFSLEKVMSSLLLEDIYSQTGLIPSRLASMSSFLMAYNNNKGIPEEVVDKILKCGPQFSILDVLNLSRGIQIALALNLKNIQRRSMEQITAVSRMLDGCAEEHLKTAESLLDVTNITRAYLCRHGSSRTFLFDKLISALIPRLHELNSRRVKDICFAIYNTKYMAPEVLDALAQYVVDNEEHILADTMDHVLNCLYNLGYYPAAGEHFFSTCTTIILNEGRRLKGLNILNMCLALNMYGHLTSKLIHNIFNVTFLDQLDEEISECYSKATYPSRVRYTLMDLNRAVCIDHPEEKIPWFHEKYCEELLQTVPVPNSVFNSEVHQALSHLVGGPNVLRANVKAPYYYLLDFEFLLDKGNRAVPVNEYIPLKEQTNTHQNIGIETTTGYRRVAVLLRKENAYCVNSRQLLGRHKMERRHLEILGYTVKEVPHYMWYSMAHATYEDKILYLKDIIYSENS